MQIVMDLDTGDLLITNLKNSIKLYAKNNIELHAGNSIEMFSISQGPAVPNSIAPTVDFDLVKMPK